MVAKDHYVTYAAGVTAPLIGAFTISPSNTEELPFVTRQIYVGADGDLSVVWLDGSETTEPVIAGDRLDWRIRQVKAAGTTASGIRGYY